MTRKVELGAPSLTGKDANDLVANEFADAQYPLSVTITNHMPRDISLPEINVFLRHALNQEGTSAVVSIDSADLFQRVASSVEQIAELNKYTLAITIEDAAVAAPEKPKTSNKK